MADRNSSAREPLNRLEVLGGLRISIWEGIWATVWIVLTGGAFQIGFALYLGASPFFLGLLAGVSAAVGLLQIPASLYVQRRGERKRFCARLSLLGRLLFIPILLIPIVLPRPLWLIAFLVLQAVSAALLTMVIPAWTSWMSDLVPVDNRGRYFGRRNMLAGLVSMLVPIPAGALLDQAVKYHRFAPRIGFGALFGLACLAAIVAYSFLIRQPEPPMAAPEPESAAHPFQSVSEPLSDRNFRYFLLFSGLFVVGQTVAAQFFTAWQVGEQGLNLPYLTVQLLGAISAGAGLISMPLWGYLGDKYGSRPMLAMAAAGTVFAPFLWLLTFPGPGALWGNVGVIMLLNAISGAAWAGFGLAQFNLLLSLAPSTTRATYVAVFSAVTGLAGGLSPILGGALMGLLSAVHIPLGALTLNNYKIVFALAGFIRLGCLFLMRRVAEPEGRSTRYVLHQLRQSRPLLSWLTLRRLSRPARESERREAVDQLADLRSPLAVEELVEALDDVSPAVREGAVHALGEIRDARAIPALAAKLSDPAAGLGNLAAQALGEIGDPEAIAPLMAAAEGPDATVRLAALRALGRLGNGRAVPTLLSALDPSNPARCETACEALAAIGPAVDPPDAAQAVVCLLPLLDPQMPRGVRLASARALDALAPRAASGEGYDTLANHLHVETDAAVAAQEAAALSRLGAAYCRSADDRLQALLPILDITSGSPLAYKQALGAVARVGLPDDTFYPYLSLPELARDETVNKLIGEMHRRLRGLPSGVHDPDEFLTTALQEYTAGDYGACLRALSRISMFFPADDETVTQAASALDALANRAEVNRGLARPEEALLGALLLRTILSPKSHG